jgi:hypothetical protein
MRATSCNEPFNEKVMPQVMGWLGVVSPACDCKRIVRSSQLLQVDIDWPTGEPEIGLGFG